MTLPRAVRVNVNARFPTRVQGGAYIAVSKTSGVWTIEPDWSLLASLASITDPANKELILHDLVTDTYNTIPLSVFNGSLLPEREVTAAGDVTVSSSDVILLINKTVGAATNVNLPASATRNGVAVYVKDLKGDAGTNNITIVPNGAELIDGLATYPLNINYQFIILRPRTSGWYVAGSL